MIKYLSGDLNQEESRALEQEIAQDKELSDAFNQVSAAYGLIGDQLRQRDEAAFRTKLREVMDHSSPGGAPVIKNRRSRWIFLVPLAASVAILVVLYIMNRGPERIYQVFFNPSEDPVILAFNQETRGDSESAISLFSQGQYEASMERTSEMLLQDPGNQLTLLFHLLAAMELNVEADVLNLVEAAEIDTGFALGRSLTWYQALAMVKSGRTMEASRLITVLTEQPGPYQSDAHKLQKMLIK